MKVLQVAHYYGLPGGIERVVSQFCECLKPDHQVEVLACNRKLRTEETEEEGIRVTRVGRVAHLNRMSICPTFPHWLRKKSPDVLHLHMVNPMAEISYLLSNLDCPAIGTYHMDITRQKILRRFHNPFLHKVLRRLDLITVSSQRFAETSPVLSRYMEKIRVLPFGISEKRFRETDYNQRLTSELHRRYPGNVVLFVGRLIHYKGLFVLLEAMSRVEGTCLIVGTGYLESKIRSAIHRYRMEDRVHLIGEATDEELVSYYDRADVFVLPSINRTESFGITQLEAMSRGTPVVCTEVGTGTTSINVDGETGLVTEPGDSRTLADAINRILSDKALADKLSRNALERYRSHFSESLMQDRLRSIYTELLT